MIFSIKFDAMFYLGSIAGILPYLLVFSLTLVLGGHAGLPFFASASTHEIKNEISEEKKLPVENLKSFSFEEQVVNEIITVFPAPFCTRTKVFNFYLLRFINSPDIGISFLRAPPSLYFKNRIISIISLFL